MTKGEAIPFVLMLVAGAVMGWLAGSIWRAQSSRRQRSDAIEPDTKRRPAE